METPKPINIKKVWDHLFQYHDIKSRNTLLEHYLPLVKYTAERLHVRFPKSVDLDDLYSVGILGLMDAIEKFDPIRNVKFESYSVLRIQGAIRDFIRKTDWVPRLVRTRAQQLQNATHRLEAIVGHSPSDEELADELQMDMEEFYHFQRDANASVLLSFNADLSDHNGDDGYAGLDMIANHKSQNPFSEVNKRDLREYVKRGFSQHEQIIIMLYYFKGMTMKEIGETMGISESRICQLHSSIIARLRGHMEMSSLCTL